MEIFKKIGIMFGLMLILIGFVVAIATLAKTQEWVALAGVALLEIAALPTEIALGKQLIPGKE